MPHRRQARPTQRSPEAAAYNAWYHTALWRALRLAHLEREPTCRMCRAAGRSTIANTVDHVKPHRGDRALFYSADNLQSLCPIHHGEKQRIEAGGRERVPINADGWPAR